MPPIPVVKVWRTIDTNMLRGERSLPGESPLPVANMRRCRLARFDMSFQYQIDGRRHIFGCEKATANVLRSRVNVHADPFKASVIVVIFLVFDEPVYLLPFNATQAIVLLRNCLGLPFPSKFGQFVLRQMHARPGDVVPVEFVLMVHL